MASLLSRALPTLVRQPPQTAERTRSWLGSVSGETILPGDQGNVEEKRPSAIVHACVRAIVNPLAALDVVVERPDQDPDPQHPAAVLWNRQPNPAWSARAMKAVLWSRLEYRGEAFVYVDRGQAGLGDPRALWPIFHRVDVVPAGAPDGSTAGRRAAGGGIAGYIAHVAGEKVPLLPDEVLWLRYPHPDDPYAAQAPWRAAEWAAGLDQHARDWQSGQLRNRAEPEGVFYLGDVDEQAHNAAVQSWRARHQGAANAARHLFLSGPTKADYTRVGLTAAEVSYIDTRRVSWDEVALAFGVPRDLLFGQSTYENQRAAKVNLWTENLVPKTEVVASEADRQLLPDPRETFGFDLSGVEALQDNEDSISTRVRENTYTDVLTLDEAREQLGLEPLPNGLGQMTLTAYRATVTAQAQDPDPLAERHGPGASHTRQADDVRARTNDEVQRAYARHEAVGRGAVRLLAERQERVVLRALESARKRAPEGVQVRVDAADVFDEDYWRKQTREGLEPFLRGAWLDGGAMTASQIGLGFDTFDPLVLTAMRSRLDVLADQVTATTARVIAEDVLLPGVEAGASIPELADSIRDVFAGLREHRAETIARTETVGGFNAASDVVAVESGVPVLREWLATGDERTRDSHRALDGQRAGLRERFANGCLFPGDPAGSPDETVNCRCVVLYLQQDEV